MTAEKSPVSPEQIPPARSSVVEKLAGLLALSEAANARAKDLLNTAEGAEAQSELARYQQFHESSIDANTAENPTEGEFRRLEFSFNLACMYAEAGFLEEAKSQIEELQSAALSAQGRDPSFGDLYWEMQDYLEGK